MKKVFLMVFRLSLVSFACLLILGVTYPRLAEAQLQPPAQDYYLHFSQSIELRFGFSALGAAPHELAWVETPGDLIVDNALTVEAWVFWDGSDLEELQLASGIDLNRMTLFCGQRAYGFYYRPPREPEPEGWTFLLETDSMTLSDTGNIPLPIGEWAHLAATYDGNTVRTFLNGILQNEGPASGTILNPGTAFKYLECSYSAYLPGGELDVDSIFGIGLGMGFQGGVRQLRIWNRALSQVEIVDNTGLHLEGTEPGLVGYWPLDGPPDPLQAPNKVAGGPPLKLGFVVPNGQYQSPSAAWRLTDPMFIVREDLAEDVVVTDCPSIPGLAMVYWPLDAQDDGDLDLIFSGQTSVSGVGLVPFRALIRDGENGFVFDTPGAIAGTVPLAYNSLRGVTADFNGDGRLDVFSANVGEDWYTTSGAPNTLLLSRPDGRLEDASDNLLAPPCNADTPQFEGQHMCYQGGDFGGRTPGVRYPGTGEAVPPEPDFTHDVAAGDIDGDGDIDILVGNRPSYDTEPAYLLINDGQGGFLANWQLMPDYLNGQTGEDDGEGRADPSAFLLEDMDGDGHVDLVSGPSQLEAPGGDPFVDPWVCGISWNDGTGDFSNAETMVLVPTEGIPINSTGEPGSSGAMLATDIDNDGDKDLLVSWDAPDYSGTIPSSLQIWVNQGGRVFVDETVARVGAPPQAGLPVHWVLKSYAEDFNQDGCPDLLFQTDQDAAHAMIWFNDCQGNFTPRTAPGPPKMGGYYIPLDFDGDGDTDLISAHPVNLHIAGIEGCSEGEYVEDGFESDYIDFAVLLNQSIPSGNINAGHSGAWFNTATSGQGQLIDVEPEEQFMFVAWFTYTDAASNNPFEQHWFTAQGNYSGNTAELILYETLGGQFDDPQEVSSNPVGEVTLSFTDCDQGQMIYRFDDEERQGSFPLQRVIPGSDNVCEGRSGTAANSTQAVSINAGMDGAWYDENTSGQGFLIDAHPNPAGDNFIFVAWFTYGEDTASGQRWLTAQGNFAGSTAEIDVFETTGGSFDDPQEPGTTKVGTMTIDFTDCSNAQLTYSLPAESAEGDIAITRVIPGGQALCEELAEAD